MILTTFGRESRDFDDVLARTSLFSLLFDAKVIILTTLGRESGGGGCGGGGGYGGGGGGGGCGGGGGGAGGEFTEKLIVPGF